MRLRTSLLLALLTGALAACGQPLTSLRSQDAGLQARGSRSAQVLAPQEVPASVLAAHLGVAQQVADEASRRREIDFFHLHAAPVGLALPHGGETAYVLSLLGTSVERTDLNVELRTLGIGPRIDTAFNYSGPVTLGLRGGVAPGTARALGLRFELVPGLPGAAVVDSYERWLDGVARHLQDRFDARPFEFDPVPLVFALVAGDEPLGFVLANQGNRLSLGDRKYADVQAVTYVTPAGDVAAAYTLVGFNAKTPTSTSAPSYHREAPGALGTLWWFGEYEDR